MVHDYIFLYIIYLLPGLTTEADVELPLNFNLYLMVVARRSKLMRKSPSFSLDLLPQTFN